MSAVAHEAVLPRPLATSAVAECILCGCDIFNEVHEVYSTWLKQCSNCSLVQAHPQPSDAELAEIYSSNYYATFGFAPGTEACYRRMKGASAARFLRLVESQISPGRLLDVGSALGDLLIAARACGWDACGVEPNTFAVECADSLLPGASFAGTLDDLDAVEGYFDLVTCVDVIEHLRRPDLSLLQMYNLLRPGGGLLVTTPDVCSIQSRILQARWAHYHIDHLWYFSRHTLAALVEAAGFEVVQCTSARRVYNLQYIFGILATSPNNVTLRTISRCGLRWIPNWLLTALLPPIPEGQVLFARRPC